MANMVRWGYENTIKVCTLDFGYSGITFLSSPVPDIIKELLQEVKTRYPSFDANGVLLTAHPPTRLKEAYGLHQVGMMPHQVIYLIYCIYSK